MTSSQKNSKGEKCSTTILLNTGGKKDRKRKAMSPISDEDIASSMDPQHDTADAIAHIAFLGSKSTKALLTEKDMPGVVAFAKVNSEEVAAEDKQPDLDKLMKDLDDHSDDEGKVKNFLVLTKSLKKLFIRTRRNGSWT